MLSSEVQFYSSINNTKIIPKYIYQSITRSLKQAVGSCRIIIDKIEFSLSITCIL